MKTQVYKRIVHCSLTLWMFCFFTIPVWGQAGESAQADQYGSFVATARHGMVVTAGEQASQAGIDMLRQGGNAVDAAVAASFAISVIRPQSTGLGGGGFFLLYRADKKETLAIDFRERAPMGATRDMFVRNGKAVPELSRNGPLAVAVPGLVAGLVEVQKKYGTMPLAKVIAPAIRLAEDGFPIYPQLAEAISYRTKLLGEFPATRAIYFRDEQPLGEGDLLVQKDLAKTLRAITQHGTQAFYKGKIARAMVEEMQKRGGLLTQKDLDAYQVKYRSPLIGTFRGTQIHSMPPPSSGGVLITQMLKVLEGFPLLEVGFHTPKAIHLLTETLRLAFKDRAQHLGDPDFTEIPIAMLTSEKYATDQRAKILPDRATPSVDAPTAPAKTESTSTTHLSVVDKAGNAVASTQTVNLYFGSGVMVPGTGILLNDEMDDFSAQPMNPNAFGLIGNTEANTVAPRKTPLSSMSPTIVTRDGKVIFVAGSPGGSRIISSILQVFLNVFVYEMTLPAAMFAPRIHHQWYPDELEVEVDMDQQPEGLAEALRSMGHQVKLIDAKGEGRRRFGNVQAIYVEPTSGEMIGVSDPRGEGRPFGLTLHNDAE